MIVWFGLLLYLFFLKMLLGNLDTNSKRKLFLVLAGIGIALIMGFRGDNYTNVYDLRVYKTFYTNISNTPWNAIFNISEFESGFVILNKLLSCIFKWDQTIIIFEACLCVFSVSYFVYKNTKYVFESILFFVTLGAMGFMLTGIRQAIAISVCLLSFESIKKKKIFIFVLAMLIAVSIHRSAIVFVVAYFILNLKILKKKKYLNLILVLGMMAFSSLILKLGNVFSSGEISDNFDLKMSFNGIVPLILYATAIAFQIVEDSHNVNKKDSGAIVTMTSVGFGLYFLRFYNMIFERIAFYYSYGHIVALSSIFDWIDKNEMKYRVLIRLLIYLLCVFLFYHRLKTADYGQYVFFWQ